MKRNNKKRGGGRSVRYTADGVRAADELMGEDPRAGRSAFSELNPNNVTLQDDVGMAVSQAVDGEGTRVNNLAETLARVAIEHSRNPMSTEAALGVYAEALTDNSTAENRALILAEADRIVQESGLGASVAMPSQLFGMDANDLGNAEIDLAADGTGPDSMAMEPEVQGPPTQEEAIRDALQGLNAPAAMDTFTLPVRESSFDPITGELRSPMLPTTGGIATALGSPVAADPAQAAEMMRGVRGTTPIPMVYGAEGSFLADRNTTPPMLQQYGIDPNANETVVPADPAGEMSQRSYLDEATGEMFTGSEGLLSNLSEYPSKINMATTVGGPRTTVTMDDRIALRRAQDVNDQMEMAFRQYVEAGGNPEDFYNSPEFQQFQTQFDAALAPRADLEAEDPNLRVGLLANLIGSGGLGNRPRGATVLESGQNPVAMYNPLVNEMSGETPFDRRLAFEQQYGRGLLSTLFSPASYGIAIDERGRGLNRNTGFRGMGFDRYETGLVAYNNLIDALTEAAQNQGLDLRFALSNRPPTTTLTGAERFGSDVSARIMQDLARSPFAAAMQLADTSNPNNPARLVSRANSTLGGILAGLDPANLPAGTIPVPTPQEFIFKGRGGSPMTALPYGGRRTPKDIDAYERELARRSMSDFDRAMDALQRAYGIDAMSGQMEAERSINPYFLFPQAGRQFGIYFDPYNSALGGAYIEGTRPTLPPELSSQLFANALRLEPSATRATIVDGLAEGFGLRNEDVAFQNMVESAKAMEAYNKPPAMPKINLLRAMRSLPETVVPNAREIIDRALENQKRGRAMPQIDSVTPLPPGMTPADDDLGALPSLYDPRNAAFAMNRMPLPMRRGVLGNLMTA